MNCKYYKQQKQVSYDNGVTWYDLSEYRTGSLYESGGTDCNQYTPIYRWVVVSNDYICDGTTKYQKTKEQVSYDNAQTWTDTGQYRAGGVIAYNSTDCDYSSQYLTIESETDNTKIYFYYNGTSAKTISASTDNGFTWTEYTSTSGISYATSPATYGTTIAILNRGGKVLLKGENATYFGNRIGSRNGDYKIYGNIMSLISGDSFTSATTLTEEYAFGDIFAHIGLGYVIPYSYLTDVSNLILPATTLTPYCYRQMFRGCESITTAPQLPATTLASYCYQYMFYGCSSLTTAPDLPATTLTNYCYSQMFYACSGLSSITCLATDISATDCTKDWVYNVASSGTFVKNSSMSSWTSGYSGIPNNWTVQNA